MLLSSVSFGYRGEARMDQQPESGQRRVVIIMPALNEADAVGQQARAIRESAALRALPVAEVIVVDNGSDDNTAEVARAAGARVVSEPARGYGAACLAGALATDADDVLLFMDADGSDDLDGAARVARLILDGEATLAAGSRTRGRSDPGALTVQQRVGNAVATVLLGALLRLHVTDLSPVKAIRRADLLALDMRERTYGWTTEMFVKAARAGYPVAETPVDYHRRAGGVSKVSGNLRAGVKAGWSILRTIARYARWRPGAPGATSASTDTLVIVAKYPQPGAAKTRLGAAIGHESAADLYRSFLLDLRERFEIVSRRDGYALAWSYAPSLPSLRPILGDDARLYVQRGEDFAARLYAIVRDAATRGDERLVILGSDSPQVADGVVTRAFAALDSHDVALGPAEDGGYYLIGLRLRPDPPDLFTGVHMSTAAVLAETLALARRQQLSVALLETAFDVDEPADLDRLRQALEADEALAPRTLATLRAMQVPTTTK
jgi:rSAM/selenodomain-associated transferase 1